MSNLLLAAEIARRILDDETKAACERSLMEFTAHLWPVTDPGQELVSGWAMDAIAAHLEAVYYGNIRRLLITVPPGFSKSSLCNVFFPLWTWIHDGQAHNRFIHASYEQGIPERDNLKCRNIIGNERFSEYWGDKFRLVVPNTKDRFENDHTGWKMATAVGAKLIGHRGNYIIIDDPNDPKVENISGLKRKEAVTWFRETVPTRLNNMATDKIIVIQQRLHMEDVAGVALSLEHEDYCHLNVPMEYEPRVYVNAYNANDEIETFYDEDVAAIDEDDIFWRDPRVLEGELAWPERFGRREVDKLKKTLGRTMVAAQLQQRPVPRGGNIVATSSWKKVPDKFPSFNFILATCDTAYTEETQNDPSACTIWGLAHDEYQNPNIYLIYAWTEWLELNALVRRLLHTCSKNDVNYGKDVEGLPRYPVDTLVIEGKASGMSVQQEIARLVSSGEARRLNVQLLPAKLLRDDKISRLVSVSHMFENGVIHAPDKAYCDQVIDQVGNFPYATHDDFVDCTSMALRWFRDCGFAPTTDEVFEEKQTIMSFQNVRKPPPLYGGV